MNLVFASNTNGSKRGTAFRGTGTAPVLEALETRTLFASFTSTSPADLIADINAANRTAAADTITLAPGKTFTFNTANNAVDGGNALPVIQGNLKIVGNGHTIRRDASLSVPRWFRLFNVPAGASLTLKKVVLSNGVGTAKGGAVLNRGALTLEGVTVERNMVVGTRSYSGVGGPAEGGGVYSSGQLTVTRSTFRGNGAYGADGAKGSPDGGAGWGWGTIGLPVRPKVPPSPGGSGLGGGLCVAGGAAVISTSSFTGNSATAGHRGLAGYGGAVYASGGTLTLRNVSATANTASESYIGTIAISGKGIGGGIYVGAAAWVGLDALTKSKVTGNTATTTANDIFGATVPIV